MGPVSLLMTGNRWAMGGSYTNSVRFDLVQVLHGAASGVSQSGHASSTENRSDSWPGWVTGLFNCRKGFKLVAI